jgi:hypothetical protein
LIKARETTSALAQPNKKNRLADPEQTDRDRFTADLPHPFHTRVASAFIAIANKRLKHAFLQQTLSTPSSGTENAKASLNSYLSLKTQRSKSISGCSRPLSIRSPLLPALLSCTSNGMDYLPGSAGEKLQARCAGHPGGDSV